MRMVTNKEVASYVEAGATRTGRGDKDVTVGIEMCLIKKRHDCYPADEVSDLPAPDGVPVQLGPQRGYDPDEAHHGPAQDDERLPEEELMFDEPDQASWSEEELPDDKRVEMLAKVPPEVRRAVRRTHLDLGHPSRQTFLDMMKLGGASVAAQSYAKTWQCPTCVASSPPHKHAQLTTTVRPFGFNTLVVMDLKYLKDAADVNAVALSIVCAGTSWHSAVFFKNRTPKHVAKKFLTTWVAHYGVPDEVVTDQGGEFQSYFNEVMYQLGIDTRVVGSAAPWQRGIAERHGGILGTTWRTLFYEHDNRGKFWREMALSAMIHAKNATLTRNGMTPEQAVF